MNANTMRSWSSLLLLLLLVEGKQNLANEIKVEMCNVDHFRLPARVFPSSYILYLRLGSDLKTFSGSVVIEMNIERSFGWKDLLKFRTHSGKVHPFAIDPNKVMLHADGLIVNNAIFSQGGIQIDVEKIFHDTSSKILVVDLCVPTKSGAATLHLDFQGRVNDETKGLFISSVDGDKVTLATHFKPDYARRLFPCFDEPEFKAIFQLIIWHPIGTTALSNTKIIEQTPLTDGFVRTIFEPTPKMSSYLLSLAVGKFKTTEKNAIDIPIAVHVPKGWPDDPSALIDEAVRAYNKVSNFFEGLNHPLKKIDIVAVNMEPIAMENWGLITVRRDLLSATTRETKPNDWIHTVIVLMSQMIHQRFANIVTIVWWSDLWLQESIAAYLASDLAAEELQDTSIELFTLLETTFSAMNDDELGKERSIRNMIARTAQQLVAAFDSFTYKKSVAIVRMFASFVGKLYFKSAVLEYVQKNYMGLFVSNNWWGRFAKFRRSGSMQSIIAQWTNNIGFPIISVQKIKDTLVVMQMPEYARSQSWVVPIQYEFHYGSGRIERQRSILNRLEPISINLPRHFDIDYKNHWLTFNAKYQGYYRVVYLHEPIFYAQAHARTTGLMPPAERLQMLSDCFSYIKQTNSVDIFDKMLQWLVAYGETDDGVLLLLIRMLTELQEKGNSSLTSSITVSNLMLNYHLNNGFVWEPAKPNLLNQWARGQVLDYLVNRLYDTDVIREIEPFITPNAQVPPFLQQVVENLRQRVQA